jgi:hypothetical protein
MDTIQDNVVNIIDEKPVEKPKKRNRHGRITQRQQLGDEDLMGLITQHLKIRLISEYI